MSDYHEMKPREFVRSRYRGAYILWHPSRESCGLLGVPAKIRREVWGRRNPSAAWSMTAKMIHAREQAREK